MKLSTPAAAPEQIHEPRHRLATVAGGLTAAFGAVHLAVTLRDTRDTWARVAQAGWWNTFTLQPAELTADLQRSQALWISVGSFGAPMIALGALIIQTARRGHPLPKGLGWLLLGWGVPFAVILPASPAWTVPLIGALLVAAGRRRTSTGVGAAGSVPSCAAGKKW